MEIVIIGGSGLLGFNLALQYREQHTLKLITHTTRLALPNTQIELADFSHCSVQHEPRLLSLLEADLVINAAGLADVNGCEQNPNKAHCLNVDMANNIAKLTHKLGVKLMHISTDHLFDGCSAYYTEECALAPKNVYAATKQLAEQLTLENNPSAAVLRTNFYGWGTSHKRSFSDWIIDSLLAQKNIQCYTDVFFTPLFINQVGEAVLSLHEKNASGIYHVAANERLSKYEFSQHIARLFELNTELITPAKYATQANQILRPLDMSLANNKLQQLCSGLNLSIHYGLQQLYHTQPMGRIGAIAYA